MAKGPGPAERVFDATRQLITTLIESGQTRLRLAVIELEEERGRVFTLLLAAGLSLIMLMLGLTMLMLLVVVAFWDTHRIAAITVCVIVLLGGGACVAWWVQAQARKKTFLKSTLKQLEIDRQMAQRRDEF